MELTIKRSQFTKGEDGRLYVDGHIEPKAEVAGQEDILEKVDEESVDYFGDNDSVGTIEESPGDQNKFRVFWNGPGTVNISTKADADLDEAVKEIFGSLTLHFIEDQATKVDMVIDGITA